jgi:hypothetical protein
VIVQRAIELTRWSFSFLRQIDWILDNGVVNCLDSASLTKDDTSWRDRGRTR